MLFRKNKSKCNCVTRGVVVSIRSLPAVLVDDSFSAKQRIVKVEYCVDGRRYSLKEDLRYSKEPLVAWKLPSRFVPNRLVPSVEVGDSVRVMYERGKPAHAFVFENDV